MISDSIIHRVTYNDVIKWKHSPRYWPFVWSPVNSPPKGQWRGALVFCLICAWIIGWENKDQAGDLVYLIWNLEHLCIYTACCDTRLYSHRMEGRCQLYWTKLMTLFGWLILSLAHRDRDTIGTISQTIFSIFFNENIWISGKITLVFVRHSFVLKFWNQEYVYVY